MQALRLNEVIQRVVRWHNRHPLARRISASQVHSIGEVLLPFAADRPWSATGAALHAPADAPLAPATPQEPPQAVGQTAGQTPVAHGDDLPALAGALLAPPEPDRPAPTDGPILADDIGDPDPRPQEPAAPVQAALADADLPAGDAEPPAGDPPPLTTEPPVVAVDAAPMPDLGDDEAASQALLAAHEAALDAPHEQPSMPASAIQSAADAAAADTPATQLEPASQPESAATGPRLADVVERRAAARMAAVAALPRGPRQWWARLRQALRGRPAGMPRLKAAFDRKVFWPSHPQTVARWAQRHAQAQPLAPEDWPHRIVEADPAQRTHLLRQGQVHGIELHALTAAIGVGDRRIRLLIGTDGSILGPRAYSRTRVASASTVLLVGLLGLGWGLRPPGAGAPVDAAELAARAASAASGPVAVVVAAASAAPAASDAASATQLAHATLAEPAEHAASAPAPHGTLPGPLAQAAEPPAEVPNLPAQAAADGATAASAPVARIRPSLSDEAKLAAKAESDRLRGGPSQAQAAAPAPVAAAVFAVVSPPNRERKVAMNHLLIMRRAGSRLPPPAPDHGELLQNQGEWRAAWWPFASLADAERARVMLASRGLRAEVVEF